MFRKLFVKGIIKYKQVTHRKKSICASEVHAVQVVELPQPETSEPAPVRPDNLLVEIHVDDRKLIRNSPSPIRNFFQAYEDAKSDTFSLRLQNGELVIEFNSDGAKDAYSANELLNSASDALDAGNLLEAHTAIMVLEYIRDELQYTPQNERVFKQLLLFSSKTGALASHLSTEIFITIDQLFELVSQDDKEAFRVLAVALCIIDREEKIDKYYATRAKMSNCEVPQTRPKRWREKFYNIVEQTIRTRVDDSGIEMHSFQSGWLAKRLDMFRRVVHDDLVVLRIAQKNCFLPEYQVFDRCLLLYHKLIKEKIRAIVAQEFLQNNDVVQLLSWIHNYGNEDMLGDPRLKINVPALLLDVPLMQASVKAKLYERFVEMTRADINEWLWKAKKEERKNWYLGKLPEIDVDNRFYTTLPSLLLGMIDDKVALCKEVGHDVIPQVVQLALHELTAFADNFRDALTEFKLDYFDCREQHKHFTSLMIATANNLILCSKSTEKCVDHIAEHCVEQTLRAEVLASIDRLNTKWSHLVDHCVEILCEEAFTDIAQHLEGLFTDKWLGSTAALDTIFLTFDHYREDYEHLFPQILSLICAELQLRLVAQYGKSIAAKKVLITSAKRRRTAALRLTEDADAVSAFFQKFDENGAQKTSECVAMLQNAATLLSIDARSQLTPETINFARRYPHSQAFITAILSCREDFKKHEAKYTADWIMLDMRGQETSPTIQKLLEISRPPPATIKRTMTQKIRRTLSLKK